MNLSELEQLMQEHGKSVKRHMEPPFDIEREDLNMKTAKRKITTTAVLAAALICLLCTGVFAARQYLSAQQVATTLNNTKLAQKLKGNTAMTETVTDGKYKSAILGVTTGENLNDYQSSDLSLSPERTYAVVAVEKTDGTPMTYDDDILVTPLIDGLKPWQYNIFTMNGGSTSKVIDGVLYRIIECDNIEYFADRKVYIGVVGDAFIDNRTFNFDEQTGKISANNEFDGTNILFDLKLDPSKANPQKAAEYLKAIDRDMEYDDEDESVDIDAETDDGVTESVEFIIEGDSDAELQVKEFRNSDKK